MKCPFQEPRELGVTSYVANEEASAFQVVSVPTGWIVDKVTDGKDQCRCLVEAVLNARRRCWVREGEYAPDNAGEGNKDGEDGELHVGGGGARMGERVEEKAKEGSA